MGSSTKYPPDVGLQGRFEKHLSKYGGCLQEVNY